MTTEKPKRDKPISYRPPKDKRARFEAMVAASGLSVNAFITECVFGRGRHRPGEAQLLAETLREEQTQTDLLRPIAQTDNPEILAALQANTEVKLQIRTALMSLLGRRS